jgi:hypothetical protein
MYSLSMHDVVLIEYTCIERLYMQLLNKNGEKNGENVLATYLLEAMRVMLGLQPRSSSGQNWTDLFPSFYILQYKLITFVFPHRLIPGQKEVSSFERSIFFSLY